MTRLWKTPALALKIGLVVERVRTAPPRGSKTPCGVSVSPRGAPWNSARTARVVVDREVARRAREAVARQQNAVVARAADDAGRWPG